MMRLALAWSGALTVMVITAVLVVLDIGDGSVHRYWSRHAFTASVLSGLLVLLLTVLIVDRVARMRQMRGQSRGIAAQAATTVARARRASSTHVSRDRPGRGRPVVPGHPSRRNGHVIGG